jgi:glycosyltransferase involved in cell wall biosynthesis
VIPNKVYEAMAVGRPIVTADTPGIREVLTDGEDALLTPPGEPQALAEALRRLAGDAELRARLGENANRRFQEVGTPRAVASRLVEVLPRGGVQR